MSEKAAAKKKAPTKKTAGKKAVRPRKRETKSEGDEGEKVAVQKVDLGPSPQPWVLARHRGETHRRPARGYSFGELGSVGISAQLAIEIGVPTDLRRRSSHEENVESLKSWYKPSSEPAQKAAKEEAPKVPKTEKKGRKKRSEG